MAEATKTKRKKKKATPVVLHAGMLLDMSGSMGVVQLAVVEGVNTYIGGLQADVDAATTMLSIAAFDATDSLNFEEWLVDQPVKTVPLVTVQRYTPRGSTPLYDSIARMVAAMEKVVGEGERALVVIVTDGLENASTEHNRESIAAMVRNYEGKGNWTFVYLGANDPAYMRTASSMGFASGNVGAYTTEPESVGSTFSSLGQVTNTRKKGASGQSVEVFRDAGASPDYRTTDKPADEPEEKPYTPEVTERDLGDLLGK